MSDARWGHTEEVIEEDMKECLDGWKEMKVLLTGWVLQELEAQSNN